jgi:mannose-6-phosphate isomerase
MDYGGNRVSSFSTSQSQILHSEEKSYHYEYKILKKGQEADFSFLKSCTIYIFEKEPVARLCINEQLLDVEVGDVFTSENYSLKFSVEHGNLHFFVAGTQSTLVEKVLFTHQKHDEIYFVSKPWGYEMWLNQVNPNFAFKKIKINKDRRTSLQYHEFKQETNVLVDGDASLYFNRGEVELAERSNIDIQSVDLKGQNVVDVTPMIIHRLEARTDLTLFEVSTPHLDDVIRLNDDTNRGDGKIQSEHPSNE